MYEVETFRGLDNVRVKKDTLLKRIETNRNDHRSIFEEAMEGWKQAVTEALDDAYRDALAGKEFRVAINLVKPQDHTDEYDTVIELLKMSEDDELVLTQDDFACYVLDKWHWQHAFLTSSSGYVSSSSNKRRIADKSSL